jgi:protein tyrosine phosphatase (PTP) superfamily phosphohydrolase (DUF442 family)
MTLNRILNFVQISPDLLTAGQPRRDQFADIAADGCQVVINLAMPTSDNALPDEAEIVTGHGMTYIHIPVVWEAPQRADFLRFCAEMQRLSGKKVFVHCALNMRVSAFVFLYRVLHEKADPETVKWDMLQIWQPEGVWQEFITARLQEGPTP